MTIYTTEDAVRDGFSIQFRLGATHMDVGDKTYRQAEYGDFDDEGNFVAMGFCFEEESDGPVPF